MHEDMEGVDWNEGHPDHEGEMAVSQLHRIAEMAETLLDIIGENDDLPGWVQYKLGRAYSDLSDAFGYIESKSHDILGGGDVGEEDMDTEEYEDFDDEEMGVEDEGEDLEEAQKKGLWYYVNKRKKANKKPHKPGEEGYPSAKAWKTVTGESEEKELKSESHMRRVVRSMILKNLKK